MCETTGFPHPNEVNEKIYKLCGDYYNNDITEYNTKGYNGTACIVSIDGYVYDRNSSQFENYHKNVPKNNSLLRKGIVNDIYATYSKFKYKFNVEDTSVCYSSDGTGIPSKNPGTMFKITVPKDTHCHIRFAKLDECELIPMMEVILDYSTKLKIENVIYELFDRPNWNKCFCRDRLIKEGWLVAEIIKVLTCTVIQ